MSIAPTITSSLSVSHIVGSTFNYELITDKGIRIEWDLSSVEGISTVDGNDRFLTGGVNLALGEYSIPVKAINYYGEDSQVLQLSVVEEIVVNDSPSVPVDNSPSVPVDNSPVAPVGEVDLFLLAGQSNANGWAAVNTLAESQKIQDGLFFCSWNDNHGNSLTTQYFSGIEPSTIAGFTKGQVGGSELGNTQFGPEIGFAARAKEINLTQNQLGFLKYAVDGSAISCWLNGSCWSNLVNAIAEGITRYEAAGYTVNLKGLIWNQGENGTDANSLNTFIAQLRTHLATNHGLVNPSEFAVVIAGQTPGWGDGLEAGVADIDPYVEYLETRDHGQTVWNGMYNLHPGSGENGIPTDITGSGNNDMYDMGVTFANKMALITGVTPVEDSPSVPVDNSPTTPSGDAWTPAQIASAYWYDASDTASVTQSNGTVSIWTDKNQFVDAYQTNTNVAPKTGNSTINGLNVFDFDGNDFLRGPVLGFEDFSKFVVFSRNTHAANSNLLSNVGGNADALWSGGTDKIRMYEGGYQIVAPTPLNLDQAYICGATKSLSSTVIDLYLDGNLEATGNSSMGTGTNQMQIGSFLDANNINGKIAEVIILPTVATTEERQKIEGYLANKWGITLPAGHPYETTAPTV